jgi:hypothetical protein
MANLENITNTTEKTDGLVRKAWLAGIGIYVKAFEEVQSQFQKINGERARLFKEFVSKGEEFTVNSKENVVEGAREETAVDKRVAEVRKQLGLDTTSTEAKISELSQKVDELTEVLRKLS